MHVICYYLHTSSREMRARSNPIEPQSLSTTSTKQSSKLNEIKRQCTPQIPPPSPTKNPNPWLLEMDL